MEYLNPNLGMANSSPPRELHLSHNFVTTKGYVRLAEAIALSPSYPALQLSQNYELVVTPLYVRLDMNNIRDAKV